MSDVNRNVKKIVLEYSLLFAGIILLTVGVALALSPIIRGGFQTLIVILELSFAVSSLVLGRALMDYSAYLAKESSLTPVTVKSLGESSNSNRLQS